jgi:hypothetical protein
MTALWSWVVRRWEAGRRATPGAPLVRWLVLGLAVAVAAAAVVVAHAVAPDDRRVVVLRLGVVGVALVVGAVARWPGLVTPALLCLGVAAVVPTATGGGAASVLAGAGLLVATGELGGWAEDLRSVVPPGAEEVRRRAATMGAWSFGAVVVSGVVLAAADLDAPSEQVALLVGGAATLVVLSFAALRRWRDRP